MNGALSNYLENILINLILRNTPFTQPATVYLALYTSDPTDADTGMEVSGGSYARQAVSFSAPTDGATSNSADIVFPEASALWGWIGWFGIRDALTAGNLLFHGRFTQAVPEDQGTAQAGAASSITLRAGASAVDGYYVNMRVDIVAGTGAGQSRRITTYNGTTKIAGVAEAWTTTPDATSQYEIHPMKQISAGDVFKVKAGDLDVSLS